MKSRLEEKYKNEIVNSLQKKLGIKNIMQVPKLSSVVLNVGVKDAVLDSKVLNTVQDIVKDIAGQATVKTKAKKSIAGFKLREGLPIGVKVTLRKQKMYSFLDKFINIALPRVRDFNGLTPKLDGNGNLNIGIKDWLIFPEVDYDKIDKIRGLNITIQTTAKNDEIAIELLKEFKIPFKNKSKRQ
ncbi:50S ribosomal protein L5 [Candidatus Dependentiae bacterium]|nr:50S ribosomal protein L5 [Candidatus Dependentiae bacterium]